MGKHRPKRRFLFFASIIVVLAVIINFNIYVVHAEWNKWNIGAIIRKRLERIKIKRW